MKIFFIRSAESVNDDPDSIRKSYPEYKITLSDLGVEQANKCGKFLKEFCEKNNIPLDKALFYTSPFERTRETADIIHDYLHIPILEDIALVEQLFCSLSSLFLSLFLHQLAKRKKQRQKVVQLLHPLLVEWRLN